MITEELIKREFIQNTITAGIRKIYSIQANLVATKLNSVTGDLLRNVQSAPFTIEGSSNPVYYMRILPYLRFLDIQYRKGSDRISRHHRSQLSLYNRTVWGVLYGETFPTIRYGYSEDVRKYVREQLESGLSIDTDILSGLSDY